jgi:hypothetical protein
MIGPDYNFKKFKASAHHVVFPSLPIFTSDNLEVEITAELQYFLIKEDLNLLHDSYDIYYESIVENNAKDALKVRYNLYPTRLFQVLLLIL